MSSALGISLFLFVVGLCFGSFGTVMIGRIPNNQSIVSPRSYCDSCQQSLRKIELIPAISYLFLLGKSKCCNRKIPKITFFCELGTAILFVLSLYKARNISELIMFLILSTITIPIAAIDLKFHRIPNLITYTAIALGLINIVGFSIYSKSFDYFIQLAIRVSLLSFTFAALYIISKGGIGIGDLKLGFVFAIVLLFEEWPMLLSVFILSFLLAGVMATALLLLRKSNRRTAISFGPFMLVAMWITIVMGSNFATNLIQLWSIR